MENFFKYKNPFINSELFYHLTFLEWIIPITIVYTIILVFIIYRIKIKEVKIIDSIIRYTMGFILLSLFITHYVLVWINNGFNVSTLPLSFYTLSCIVCLILTFTKNKKLYSLALYSGVIGGMVNMLFDQVGYSYQYFRYYQFMISNGLMIIIPLYFLIVHDFVPNFKQLWKSLVIMQVVILFILLFNHQFDTKYMLLTFGENRAYENSFISYLGDWPWYLIWVELIVIALIFLIYGIINICVYQYEKTKNERIHQAVISQQSFYMTKKKK